MAQEISKHFSKHTGNTEFSVPQKFLLSYGDISQDGFSCENRTMLLNKCILEQVNSPNAEVIQVTAQSANKTRA